MSPTQLRQPLRQMRREHRLEMRASACPVRAALSSAATSLPGRRSIDDRVALAPVRRDLEDRRPAEPAMGEQQRLLEPPLAAARPTASVDTPASGASRSSIRGSKVSGTSAGRVSVTRSPNCCAS